MLTCFEVAATLKIKPQLLFTEQGATPYGYKKVLIDPNVCNERVQEGKKSQELGNSELFCQDNHF